MIVCNYIRACVSVSALANTFTYELLHCPLNC